jgi:hypothetical protein
MPTVKALAVKPVLVAQSINANVNGPAFDLLPYEDKAIIALNAGALTGTNPTLDVKIQHSADGSTGWADVVLSPQGTNLSFGQVTTAASAQQIEFNTSDLKRYIRAVATVGGTSPAGVAGVSIVAQKQSV